MGLNVRGNDITDIDLLNEKLQFLNFSSSELLEKFITISASMGIDKTLLSVISASNPTLTPSNPTLYLVAIIRRHLALQKEGNRFGILGFGRKGRRNELKDIMAKVESNVKDAAGAKEKLDSMFSKGPDGIYRPISVEPKTLRDYVARMQPVYVVGGSVYTFSGGGFGSAESGVTESTFKAAIDKRNASTKRYSGGAGGVSAAYVDSKAGANMGAFGTQEAP